MALEDTLRSLREFDVNDIDFDNIGSWPTAVKAVLCVLLLVLVVAGGYYYHIKDLQLALGNVQAEEERLRSDYEKKAFQAANLEAYKAQMVEMEESFGALVSQLPSDTEVPGLLEDITNKGLMNGLEINSIALQPEQAREFYVERLGCRPARQYEDRITLDFFGDQVVCHQSPDKVDETPEMYPRHFGVTFRDRAEFDALLERAQSAGLEFFQEPFTRFAGKREVHSAFFLLDPSNNVLEFKHYADPAMMY